MQLPRQLTISKTSKKKSQWIICHRLNTQTLREVNKDGEMKKTDTETETELKNECLCDISHWALWLAFALSQVLATHSQNASLCDSLSSALGWCSEGRGCYNGCLSQTPQVTSTPQFCIPIPLQPTHVCLWICTAFKKNQKNSVWIYFLLVSVSRCRDSTSVILRSFISVTVLVEILIFPINDWFYV